MIRFPKTLSLWTNSDGSVEATDQGGFYMTREEYEALKSGLDKFFSSVPDGYIEKYNAELHDHYFNRENAPAEKQERKKTPGFIYVIKSGEYHKIGRTINLERRLRDISSTVGPIAELALVHSFGVDDTIQAEAELHERFSDKRIRGRGEWFDLSQEDVDYICGIQSQNGSGL